MAKVRSSKYRHVYGDPIRKDKCYDNIRLTKNAFDANLAKSNGKYISLNWDASGGGSFAVIPTAEQGKLPDRFPLFDGHRGPVLDTDWNPFDDEMVVSASDDATIGVWRVPENFSVREDYGTLDDCKDIKPIKFLTGHGKKVGHVGFNPAAANILASTSLDNTVKIWNVETGEDIFTLKHPSFVTSFSWNYEGTKLATVAKDRILRIWDVRGNKICSEGKCHAGAKGSRVIWLGETNRVLTTGFSLISDREMALWDAEDIGKGPLGGFRGLDPSSGVVIPHYDPMTSILYLGGRGDGKIVYYEFADDNLYDLFAYNSTSPQRGLGWVPNRSLDPQTHEVARVYKVHETMIEPIPFRVPLKTEGFLDNVYKFVEAGLPALTADEWKAGKNKRPLVKNWKDVHNGKEAVAVEAPITSNSGLMDAKLEEAKNCIAHDDGQNKQAKSEKTEDLQTKDNKNKDTKSEIISEEGALLTKQVPTQKDIKNSQEFKSNSTLNKSVEKLAALDKAEKQDSYDVLQSDDVRKFLAKTSENIDEISDEIQDDNSDWEAAVSETDTSTVKQKSAEIKNQAEPPSNDISISGKLSDESPVIVTKSEGSRLGAECEQAEERESRSITPASNGYTSIDSGSFTNDNSKFDEILKRIDELSQRISSLESVVKK